MANCKYCGQEVKGNEKYCPNCGAEQIRPQESAPQPEPTPVYNRPQEPAYNQNAQPAVVDNGGFGWGLLGCCIPLVGLILFLVWKDTKPKTAKAAGIGALVSVGISVVFYILSLVLGFSAAMMGY